MFVHYFPQDISGMGTGVTQGVYPQNGFSSWHRKVSWRMLQPQRSHQIQDFTAKPPEDTIGTEDSDWNKEPASNNSKTTQLSDRLDQNRKPGKKAITLEHNSQISSQRYSLHPQYKVTN